MQGLHLHRIFCKRKIRWKRKDPLHRQENVSNINSRIEGEFKFGEPSGDMTLKKDGQIYVGQTKNSLKEGWGTLTDADGSTYEGVFINNQMDGPIKIIENGTT